MSTPAIDIRPDHWQIVRHILRLHVPQYAVWAFGSRAKWTAKPHSDLDLAIITDKPLPLSVSAALADDFSESNLPWKVDVVDWAATSESFRKVIERDKVVVHTPIEMDDWRETTLGEVCKLQGGSIQTGPFGSQLHASDYTITGTPVVMPVNLIAGSISEEGIARISDEETARLARHKLAPGDIVFSRRGDVTRFALVSERESGWLCGTGCLKVSVGDSTIVTPGFVAAVLASPESKEWLIRHAVGATMPNLNTEILAGIPITLPPIEEQRAIAHILGTLDDKIKLNRRINQTLEAMARALFKSWFVDFDGVPQEDMQESELGLIPKGWRAGTLADFAALNPETWTKQTRPDEIFYVDLSNTKWGRIESVTPYVAEDAPSRAQRVLRSNDTIVGTVRPGNGSYAFIDEERLTGSTGFAVLRPKREEYAALVYIAATAPDNIDRLANLADGGAYPAVRSEIVSSTSIAVADEKTITKFSQHVFPMLKRIAHSERESRTLAALRDTLLPRLISRQLRVNQ